MGTRGAFGFRINGVDKVTYNHFDSYPTGLGAVMIQACIDHTLDELKAAAEKLTLVTEDKKPTKKQIEVCKAAGLLDLNVGNQTEQDWYDLLRGAQGDIEAFIDGRTPFMIDSHAFLTDSLFCEWAYIINCDEKTLEVYDGCNKNPAAPGRYANIKPDDNGYVGVKLLRSIPLAQLRHKKGEEGYVEWLTEQLEAMCAEA
jgi:hypothetical protein